MVVPEFTSHNIALPDGTLTRPGAPLLADTGICQAALRDLDLAFPGRWRSQAPGDPRRWTPAVADLGCLEGGYAVEFARAGYDVMGIEARSDNTACCEHVARQMNMPNLHFIQEDARVSAASRIWDATFCCGLLYHLDRPVEFLNNLGRATRRLLILQTHYSNRPDAENEGRAGHWYGEGGSRWSAHGNTKSFWLTKPDLLDVMYRAGFPLVFEQFDYLDSIHDRHYVDQQGAVESTDRGMFVGIKP
jgi:SAM-dependent methyltransferase